MLLTNSIVKLSYWPFWNSGTIILAISCYNLPKVCGKRILSREITALSRIMHLHCGGRLLRTAACPAVFAGIVAGIFAEYFGEVARI